MGKLIVLGKYINPQEGYIISVTKQNDDNDILIITLCHYFNSNFDDKPDLINRKRISLSDMALHIYLEPAVESIIRTMDKERMGKVINIHISLITNIIKNEIELVL